MSKSRRRETKRKSCWCCQDQRRSCRMVQASAETLNMLELPKRKRWSQCDKDSSLQVHQSLLCEKEKEQSQLSESLAYEEGESQGGKELHLVEKEEG